MGISGIISALVVGLIVGALARLVVPGKQNIPIWLTIVIGIVAAFVGGWIGGMLGLSAWWAVLIVQVVVGAVAVAAVAGTYGRRAVAR